MIKLHSTKHVWVSGDIAPRFINMALDGDGFTSFTSLPFYAWENNPVPIKQKDIWAVESI